ncbi:hypothetical protein JJB07_23380 [Tumebacillus sp. ITR2]|uniref:Uncharacterized protein n=1 Tax=Tumebacillus amylolyticus TaxID=2801339 RepID=A0ABS1JGX6_9BACL|nr:hypothetical protein [Tumebacillus amylolyticus]MBL0389490.1 hypothetical protein [Tumebacillus amylolyticus]
MMLSKETVYDLENFYDRIADEDEELVDQQFTKLETLHQDVVKKNKYKKDDIDDKLVTLFVQSATSQGIEEKWAKGYLFYEYFDKE